jgi:hypothetical protein
MDFCLFFAKNDMELIHTMDIMYIPSALLDA